jgi:hypothetical protein
VTTPAPDDTLAARIQALQARQPWMDPAATVTLANSTTSDPEMHGIADGLRQQVSQVWDGISHFFDDPVLHQQETPNLTLQRYLTGTTGTWPVEDRSLVHIQAQLQKKGYGQGLDVNGKWDAGWQTALQQHALAEYNSQIAGNQTGAKSSTGLLHSILNSISPSGAADAVVGFIKSIPGDVRQLASDIGGTAAQAGHGVEQLFTDPSVLFKRGGDVGAKTRQVRGTGQAAVNQALGGDLTREQAVAQAGTGQDFNNLINDVGTIYLFTGMGGAAKGIGGAVTRESGAGLATRVAGHEAAVRGQGVVAKSLLKPVVGRTVVGAGLGAGVGGVQAELTGGDVGQAIGAGAVLGGLTGGIAGRSARVRESAPVQAAHTATDKALSKLLPARYYDNLPIAGNTGPILGRLANDDGLYYRARTRLATPYQYGAVRAAGSAFSQAQAFSLKAHGLGYVQSLFGDQAGLIQDSIDNANVLDPINDTLRNRLAFTIAGQTFKPDLDYLMYFLHGPLKTGAEGTASKATADSIKGLMDGYSDALGHTNLMTQIEQATGHSRDDLVGIFGGEHRLNVWAADKVRHAAATMQAERVYATGMAVAPDKMPQRFTDAYYDLLRAESSATFHDNTAMERAIAALTGGNDNYLQNYLKDEMGRSLIDPKAYLKHQGSDYLDAGDLLTHQVLPHADEFLLKPKDVQFLPKGVDPAVFGGRVPNELRESGTVLAPGPTIPGSIGLARTTTLTSQQATRDVQRFADEILSINQIPDATEKAMRLSALHDEMNAYLFHNFGQDARKLNVFAGSPEKALGLITDRGKKLAAEVHLTPDAPDQLKQAFAAIEAKGYRVVAGTDIGHAFRSDLPPLKELGTPLTKARRIAQAVGVSPQAFSRLDYGVDRRYRVVSALQSAVDAGHIKLPSYYTVQTILNDLQDDQIVQKQLPWAAHTLFGAFRRAHQGAVKDLMRTGTATSPEQALATLESHIASAAGMRSLTYSDFKRVLGRTDNVPWLNAEKDATGLLTETNTIPLMDDTSIKAVYKAVQKGYADTPTSMLGAQKVEDFIRYLPFRARLGDRHLPFALSSLPTGYANFRDTYRFTLSPYFDLRRVAKTNVKMAVDGVVPTVHPVAELKRTGNFDQAHTKLDQLLGEENAKYKYLDEADRYLDSQGVFGLYNPRHYEAYYVAQKQAAGASDAEIKEGLVRVFQYGSRGKEGRTALERTTNVIFFPFSFEKTVARNIGSYLLDHGAQAMVLSNALAAYRQFSADHQNNPLSMRWIEKHTPLMEELLRLNTFAHGMSMGELGGVNRPLLNLFLPQSYDSNKDTLRAVQRFVPLTADLHRIINESKDQSSIVQTSLRNGLDQIVNGTPKSVLTSRPVAETQRAQLDDARIYRSQLLSAFEQVLDYNAHVGSDEEKVTWGLGAGIPPELRGQPISKTTLGQVVKDRYPAYDPLKAADYAIAKKVQAEQWLSNRVGTPEYAAYKDFYDKAQTAIAHLNKDDYPTGQAAQVQDLFRQQAINFAHTDAAFLKFYNTTFKSAFGPLEAVR